MKNYKLLTIALAAAITFASVLMLREAVVFAPAQAQSGKADTAVLFQPVLETVQHPRCMNCHTTTKFPRQNDARRRHLFGVVRGNDNHGIPGMQCTACHGEANNDVAGVPGAPHWGLAPLSMAWEYMTPVQICAQLKDPERNGGKSLENLRVHMTEDPLVLWAWAPGLHPNGIERSRPRMSKTDWIVAVEAWIQADAPCPTEPSTNEGTE